MMLVNLLRNSLDKQKLSIEKKPSIVIFILWEMRAALLQGTETDSFNTRNI